MECPIAPGGTRVARKPESISFHNVNATGLFLEDILGL